MRHPRSSEDDHLARRQQDPSQLPPTRRSRLRRSKKNPAHQRQQRRQRVQPKGRNDDDKNNERIAEDGVVGSRNVVKTTDFSEIVVDDAAKNETKKVVAGTTIDAVEEGDDEARHEKLSDFERENGAAVSEREAPPVGSGEPFESIEVVKEEDGDDDQVATSPINTSISQKKAMFGGKKNTKEKKSKTTTALQKKKKSRKKSNTKKTPSATKNDAILMEFYKRLEKLEAEYYGVVELDQHHHGRYKSVRHGSTTAAMMPPPTTADEDPDAVPPAYSSPLATAIDLQELPSLVDDMIIEEARLAEEHGCGMTPFGREHCESYKLGYMLAHMSFLDRQHQSAIGSCTFPQLSALSSVTGSSILQSHPALPSCEGSGIVALAADNLRKVPALPSCNVPNLPGVERDGVLPALPNCAPHASGAEMMTKNSSSTISGLSHPRLSTHPKAPASSARPSINDNDCDDIELSSSDDCHPNLRGAASTAGMSIHSSTTVPVANYSSRRQKSSLNAPPASHSSGPSFEDIAETTTGDASEQLLDVSECNSSEVPVKQVPPSDQSTRVGNDDNCSSHNSNQSGTVSTRSTNRYLKNRTKTAVAAAFDWAKSVLGRKPLIAFWHDDDEVPTQNITVANKTKTAETSPPHDSALDRASSVISRIKGRKEKESSKDEALPDLKKLSNNTAVAESNKSSACKESEKPKSVGKAKDVFDVETNRCGSKKDGASESKPTKVIDLAELEKGFAKRVSEQVHINSDHSNDGSENKSRRGTSAYSPSERDKHTIKYARSMLKKIISAFDSSKLMDTGKFVAMEWEDSASTASQKKKSRKEHRKSVTRESLATTGVEGALYSVEDLTLLPVKKSNAQEKNNYLDDMSRLPFFRMFSGQNDDDDNDSATMTTDDDTDAQYYIDGGSRMSSTNNDAEKSDTECSIGDSSVTYSSGRRSPNVTKKETNHVDVSELYTEVLAKSYASDDEHGSFNNPKVEKKKDNIEDLHPEDIEKVLQLLVGSQSFDDVIEGEFNGGQFVTEDASEAVYTNDDGNNSQAQVKASSLADSLEDKNSRNLQSTSGKSSFYSIMKTYGFSFDSSRASGNLRKSSSCKDGSDRDDIDDDADDIGEEEILSSTSSGLSSVWFNYGVK